MIEIIIITIKIILYSLLSIGIFTIFGPSFRCIFLEFTMRKRLKTRRKQEKQASPFRRHLDNVLLAVIGKRVSSSAFIFLCLTIFLLVLLPTFNYYGWLVALLSASLMASFPYMFLRSRLENMRKKVCSEGEEFLGEFLSNYRATSSDVLETMARISATEKSKGQLTILLSKMLYQVRNDSSSYSVKIAEEQFSFAVNSNWGKMFTYNLGVALTTGEDISLALEDIFIQLREARVLGENRKRLNAEATKMVLFLVPGMYITTALVSVHFIGLSWREFLRHQFMTSQGFLLFLMIIGFFLLNVILTEMVNHQRFDF